MRKVQKLIEQSYRTNLINISSLGLKREREAKMYTIINEILIEPTILLVELL